MELNNISSLMEFNQFLENCSDDDLKTLTSECKSWLTNGFFPKNSELFNIMERSTSTITALDICISISFSYIKRFA